MRLEKLGRYQIKGQIGASKRAQFFRAYDPAHDRDVVIKLFRPEFVTPHLINRVKREIRALSQIEYHALVTVLNAGLVEKHKLFIVLEAFSGCSLAKRLTEGDVFPLYQAVHIVGRIAEATIVLHNHGMLHLDINPASILLNELDDTILGGFLAEAATDNAYCTPEQWEKQPLTAQTDIYALGLLLMHLIFGNTDDRLGAIQRLPEIYRPVLTRATTSDPTQRYESAEAFADALAEAMSKTMLAQINENQRLT